MGPKRAGLFALLAALITGSFSPIHAQANLSGPLRAGAAKVDVTPQQSEMRFPGTDIIRDHLYVRAVVVDNGKTCAVIVSSDARVHGKIWSDGIAGSTQTTGCPAGNFFILGTGCHSCSSDNLVGKYPTAEEVTAAIIKSVAEAKSKLQPAKVGFGTTKLDLTINKDLFESGKWYQGDNPDGPSDKTLSVLGFIGNDNRPIAVVMNYAIAVHYFYLTGVLSADIPGDACNWVEQRFEGSVALFAQGATLDQNEIWHDLAFKLVGYRLGDKTAESEGIIGPSMWKVEAEAVNTNSDHLGALAKPLQPENMAGYKATYQLTSEFVRTMGIMMGESAIRVLKTGIPDYVDLASISADQQGFSCPGRVPSLPPGAPAPREGVALDFKDGPPVPVNVGELRIGDINAVFVEGEAYSEVGMRIKAESPARKTMVITEANGQLIMIPSNDAYSHLTFQMIGNRFKPGCAEDETVSTAEKLIRKAQ